MILTVGLTGGIGSGKSTIARLFREWGAEVVDADELVRELYRPGEAGHRAIVAEFGSAVLAPDGEIDRMALSAAALRTPDGAAKLNGLIHPLVLKRERDMLLQRLERGLDGIFVVEATLLLEAGGKGRYDRIVVVDAEPEKQVARAMGRGLDESEVRLRMSRQMDRETRLRQADYVIDNDGSMEESRAAARTAFDMLERDLAEKKKVSA